MFALKLTDRFHLIAVRIGGDKIKEPPLFPAPLIPVTPKKQITKESPARLMETMKPVCPSLIIPMKAQDSEMEEPNSTFGPASSPYNFPTPIKHQQSITTTSTAKFSASPPKVKLNDAYTDNSYLPPRGRAILRKDTIIPEMESERNWSPVTAKANLSPSKPDSNPYKDQCRGNSIVPVGSEHQAIHTRRKNISNKLQEMYRERSQRSSPIQIGKTDGNQSRHASKVGVPENVGAIVKPGGRIGSRIAALRRLFDGGSQSKSSDPQATGLIASKSSRTRASRVVEDGEGDRPVDLLPQRSEPQNAASGFKTPSVKPIDAPESAPRKMPARSTSQAPVTTSRAPMTEPPQRGKTKIGDKIQLFEGISKGKEKIERRFKRSSSLSTKATRKSSHFRRETGGLTYLELKEVAGKFSDNSDRAKEGKRRSIAGIWNDLKSGRGGSNKANEDESELIIKEVQCGLREPKPLRVTEMNKVMALCKDFGGRVVSGGSTRGPGKEKGSRDSMRVPP